jgi:predicted RNA binding protein YcfA (HicA-like mRNA interferase family)
MPFKRNDVEAALVRKGFQKSSGDHNFFIYRTLDGKITTVRTKTSHGHREIGDNLIAVMARQCSLTVGDFNDLVNCTLSRGEYEDKLRSLGKA